MLFRSDPQESEIVLRVNVAHHTPRLGGELMQQAGVLNGGRVVERGFDRYALGVDHDEADDALVGRDSFDCLLYFGLEYTVKRN